MPKLRCNSCAVIFIEFEVRITKEGVRLFMERKGYSWKRLTKMDRRAFSEVNIMRTRRFLLRRLGIDVRDCVFIDEMLYKKGEVGNNYGWALVSDRALQSHVGKDDGEAVMFLAAVTCEEVLPVTLPVPQPLTVTAFLFEFWIMFCVILAMLARGEHHHRAGQRESASTAHPARYTLVVRI